MDKPNAIEFFEGMDNKKTIKTYKSLLNKYFKKIYDLEESSRIDFEEYGNKYINEERSYEKDFEKIMRLQNGTSRTTIRNMLNIVKNFLEYHEIELSKKLLVKLKRKYKNARAQTEHYIPSKPEIQAIIQHSAIQGRSLFLSLISSGMRIGEALRLELDDIEKIVFDEKSKEKITKIRIPADITKGNYARTTFLSSEASDVLDEWIKFRPQYIEQSIARSGRASDETKAEKRNTSRVWPMGYLNAMNMLKNACEKAKLVGRDKSTNRRKFHIHMFRAYFKTQMSTVTPRIHPDVVNKLIGHNSYLSNEYLNIDTVSLAKFYKQAESKLTIIGGVADKILKKRLIETSQKLESKGIELQKTEESQERFENRLVDMRVAHTKLKEEHEALKVQVEKNRAEYLEFQKELKHFEKNGVMIAYTEKSGFLPDDLEKISIEVLYQHGLKLNKEVDKISNIIKEYNKKKAQKKISS